MLKVIHTSDLHVGKNRKHDGYLAQQRLMLTAILRQVEEALASLSKDYPVWLVVAGDVFDRNEDTTREEFTMVMLSFFLPIHNLIQKHPNFTAFVIDGNHDRQTGAQHPSLLSPIKEMTTTWERFHMAVCEPMLVDNVLLVPFNGYSESEFNLLLDKHPKAQFVVMHECISRMVTDVGYTTPRDQDKYIEINNVTAGRKLAGIFAGDIHKSQSLNDIFWYSGSPITLDHGHKLPKGVLQYTFDCKDGIYSRVGDPVLVPLTGFISEKEPKLKSHYQIGVVADPEKVNIEELKSFTDSYLQLVVTPEVYGVIDKALPEFFSSPNVSWEFAHDTTVATEEEVEQGSVDDYYKPLIRQWVKESLVHLVDDEREECLTRLFKIFEGR